MSAPIYKKQIAAAAGITPRTMQRHAKDWKFIERFRAAGTSRSRYRQEVLNACRRRKLIS